MNKKVEKCASLLLDMNGNELVALMKKIPLFFLVPIMGIGMAEITQEFCKGFHEIDSEKSNN